MPLVTILDNTELENRPSRCEADWVHDLKFEIWTALSPADAALVSRATVRLLVDNFDYPVIDDDIFTNYWFCPTCEVAQSPARDDPTILGGKSYGDPPGLFPDFFMSDETRLTLTVDFPDGISQDLTLLTSFPRWRYSTTPPLDCILRPGAYYPQSAKIIPVVSNCARTLEPLVTETEIPARPRRTPSIEFYPKPPEYAAVIDGPGCQAIPVKFIGCIGAVTQSTVVAEGGGGGPQELTLLGAFVDLSPPPQGTYEGWQGFERYPFPSPSGRIPVDRPGSLGAYRLNVGSNTQGVITTFELLVNGVSAVPPLVISVPATTTGVFSLDASAVAVVAGDTLSVHGIGSGGPIDQLRGVIDIEFIPD